MIISAMLYDLMDATTGDLLLGNRELGQYERIEISDRMRRDIIILCTKENLSDVKLFYEKCAERYKIHLEAVT
ncbi:MAG TPA: hypothetical protein ENH62_15920 [Marinobacter sp.]|uniref:Uncharacterized protein n=1 Tax=marine sediment metagenome TaxID=412755 RepID=A0A0F9WKX3_9ZZZZ|nr:hypothetical protein [Marinobacter sp.]